MDSDQKVVAALGRPFTLGMLYDAHKDELVTGFTLWDKKTLQEHRSVHCKHSSVFEVTSSDSIESKSNLLNIDASLKASFLCGLIEVEGSAKYLNDQKKFKNQSRVTLQYKVTTSFEQLSIVEEEAKNKMKRRPRSTAVPEKESATHVVTGILYGANAFFVFDSEKLDASSVQDLQGKMKALIKNIPTFDANGKVDIKLTEEEKNLANKFSCKFIGDFILPSNPSTFEEAVQTYVGLPKLLGEKNHNAVPLQVWLTPLKKFIPTAVELMVRINTANVTKVETALEDIGQAERRCNECLDDEVVQNMPQIEKKLIKFKRYCEDYKSQLQQSMKTNLNLIRKEENVSVEKLFDEKEDSPFTSDNLNKWLNSREREINIIRSCVEIMKVGTNVKMVGKAGTNVMMVGCQSDLDREILAPGVVHALCFVFTSVKNDDAYLDEMAKYLETHDCDGNVPQSWCDTIDVSKMREKAAAFYAFANRFQNNSAVCFLIATMPNDKYQGATTYRYKNGVLVTEEFSPLIIPDAINDRADLFWYACDLTMDSNTVNDNLTLSDKNKTATYGESQKYDTNDERFDTCPQVLCTKALTGRHYWEVEWNADSTDIKVGVTYKTIQRKGESSATELGSNDMSWCFYVHNGVFGSCHNNEKKPASLTPGCNRVGVYLDWPAGNLSFYDATSTTMIPTASFSATFTDAVYPGFWVNEFSSSVSLCPL